MTNKEVKKAVDLLNHLAKVLKTANVPVIVSTQCVCDYRGLSEETIDNNYCEKCRLSIN